MVGLGSSGVGIGLSVTLLDNFTATASRVAAGMSAMSNTINARMQSNLMAARRWGLGMAVVGGLALAAFSNAHASFRKFDWEMVTVAAVTGKTRDELKTLDTLVKTLAQKSIFDPQAIASASTRLAKAGFELKQIENSMQAVVSLGTATDTDIGGKSGVADMMAKIMRSFDIAPEHSTRVADVITKSVNSAAMDMNDAFEALKFLGNTSSTFGLKLEDSMAMIGVLANAGVPQGIAGRGLVNALNKIAISASQFAKTGSKKALTALGLTPSDLKDASGNMMPIVDILDKLIARTAKMGNVDKVAALSQLLMLRGERAMLPLLAQYNKSGGKGFKEFRDMLLRDSEGEAARVAGERMKSAEGVFRIMHDSWKTLKTELGGVLTDMFVPMYKLLTRVFNGISTFIKTPLGKYFSIAATSAAVLLTVAGAIVVVMSTLGLLMVKGAIGFTTMWNSLVWGWNAAAAAAMRYAGVVGTVNTMQGGNLFTRVTSARPGSITPTSTGSVAVKGVKGFQRAGTAWTTSSGMAGPGMSAAARGAAASRATKVLPMAANAMSWTTASVNMGKASSSMLGGIGRLVGGLFRLIGPIGMIVSILGTIIGWDNVLKGIKIVLGTIGNIFKWLYDIISAFSSLDFFGMSQASIDFSNKQRDLFGGTTVKEKYNSGSNHIDRIVYIDRQMADLSEAGRKDVKASAMKDKRYSGYSQKDNLTIQNNIVVDNEILQREIRRVSRNELSNMLQ